MLAKKKKSAVRLIFGKSSKGGQKAKIIVIDAPPEKAFWVNNGPVLKNLKELRDALRSMRSEQFDYHTKRSGNDFSRWVSEVLREAELARKILKASSRDEAAEILGRFLA